MRIRLNDELIYRGRLSGGERSDVAEALGRPDWLLSGFSIVVQVPKRLEQGTYPLQVSMHLSDGSEFALEQAPAQSTLTLEPSRQASWASWLCAVTALLLPLLAMSLPPQGVRKRKWHLSSNPRWFLYSLLLSMGLLVSAGISGSSLELAFHSRQVTSLEERHLVGDARGIRSDEWEVITPLALSQLQHTPAFPVVNRHLGGDGQNMLVIGMTGIPVAHLSAWAKPATWGFFTFDLARALAWYWWTPFFLCLISVWFLLRRMFALDWRMAAVLSLCFTAAPYSVGFSGWPAYLAGFAAGALVLADVALRTTHGGRAAVLGVAVGMLSAGFALVLYPAWQLSLAYALLPLAAVWWYKDRQHWHWGRAQWIACACALLVGAVLMWSWWEQVRDTVAVMRATVYPGQRSTEAGGDVDTWMLIKGLTNWLTMYHESGLLVASDAGSYVFFWPALWLSSLLAWRTHRRALACTLWGVVGVIFVFIFIGFPPVIAKWTLWGTMNAMRFDLALGLLQTLLLAWLMTSTPAEPQTASLPFAAFTRTPDTPRSGQASQAWHPWGAIEVLGSLGCAAVTGWFFTQLPVPIAQQLTPALILLSMAAVGVCSYCLLKRRYHAFLGMYALWTLGMALPFNPVRVMPNRIELNIEELRPSVSPSTDAKRSVAVVGQRAWAMTLPTVGVPVVNSVFYHPQPSLWKHLDPDGLQRAVYNRYQRLLFKIQPDLPQPFQLVSPRLDEVRVLIHPVQFDFRLLQAHYVLADQGDEAGLDQNPSLEKIRASSAWVLYRTVAPEPRQTGGQAPRHPPAS